MTLATYLVYLGAVAVFFATPPDTGQLLVIANSARHGLRRSLLTVAGDLTANAVQMTGAAFGLAALIASSATAFVWIKWFGVAYLAWIGLRLIVSKAEAHHAPTPASGDGLRLFRQGFVTSMANPFAVVFFGALFPQFIDPDMPVLLQLLVLGLTYFVVDGAILIFWGWLGVRAATALRGRSFVLIDRICGAVMVAAAALLVSKDLRPER